MRKLLAVLVAVAALPLFAEDLSIEIEAAIDVQRPAQRVAVGETVRYIVDWRSVGGVPSSTFVVEFDAPGTIGEIEQGAGATCSGSNPVRCTPAGFWPDGWFAVNMPVTHAGTHTATARIVYENGFHDSEPANDVATHTFEAFAQPSLVLFPSVTLGPLRPRDPARFSVYVQNRSGIPATNLVLTVTLPAGGTFVSAPSNDKVTCTIASNVLTCTQASLTQGEATFMIVADIQVLAPDRMTGEPMLIDMTVTSAGEELDPSDNHLVGTATMIHQFAVTNVQDEGSGSLRQTILDMNAQCEAMHPCEVLFRIPAPVPPSGWFIITPRTELPELVASAMMDGATQTLFTGDTNANGPEIEIDGALLAEGSGLRFRPNCQMYVRNLAVNNFPGYGIEVAHVAATIPGPCYATSGYPEAVEIRDNYLGTDASGRIAKPNQRGLGIFTNFSLVHGNLISGNERAGLYAGPGHYLQVTANRIGISSDGKPLGNGAGMFFDVGQPMPGYGGADIIGNVIAHNRGMGIARTAGGEIYITQNSIFGNLQQGIDVGVDGVSAPVANDVDTPNAPVLFDASYDAVNDKTTVRGRVDSDHYATPRTIDVYASSGLSTWGGSEAEQWLVSTEISSGHQNFEIAVPGDQRGKWITATHSVARFIGFARGIGTQNHRSDRPGDTSELSNAVVAR